MFQFLQPISLFAMAGIVVPIVIHLVNIQRGKVLQVGSIALLTQSDRQQARSVRLKELLLLIFRCLLLLLLALLLAKPTYTKKRLAANEKGWLLIEKNHLQPAYEQYQPLIDSLNNAGYVFHFFEDGFKSAVFADALQQDGMATTAQRPYWSLLQVLDTVVHRGVPVYLFTGKQLQNFNGKRPAVSLNLQWKTVASADTASTFIADAYLNNTGTTSLFMANSSAEGTSMTEQMVSLQQPPPGYQVNEQSGLQVSFTDERGNSSNIKPDTSKMQVVVYTDKYRDDAAYIVAALKAIRSSGKHRINIFEANTIVGIPAVYNWLFWLSETPVPANLNNGSIVAYAAGREQKVQTWLTTKTGHLNHGESIAIMKQIQPPGTPANPLKVLWRNGYGQAILGVETGARPIYHLYSRFNPSWSDLVWSPRFTELIYSLLYSPAQTLHALDKRVIDDGQMRPVKKAAGTAVSHSNEVFELDTWIWVLALLVFAVERWLSFKTKKEVSYG